MKIQDTNLVYNGMDLPIQATCSFSMHVLADIVAWCKMGLTFKRDCSLLCLLKAAKGLSYAVSPLLFVP